MTPTKVLFLDVDGVLNSIRSCHAHNGYPHDFDAENMALFDHVAIGLIRKLCQETGTRIVLSSSWRIRHSAEECANGLGLPIFDSTPILDDPIRIRGNEIKAWLDAHPSVTTYAIVDDDSDMLTEQRPYFVKTDIYEGLTYRNYRELKGILNGGTADMMRDAA